MKFFEQLSCGFRGHEYNCVSVEYWRDSWSGCKWTKALLLCKSCNKISNKTINDHYLTVDQINKIYGGG